MNEPCDDIGGSAYYSNPYVYLNWLRDVKPVFKSTRLNRWIVTRYDDACTILQDDVSFSSMVIPSIPAKDFVPELNEFIRLSSQWLFFQDPPTHSYHRAHVVHEHSVKVVHSYLESIYMLVKEICVDLINRMKRDNVDSVDLIRDYSHAISARAITSYLCRSENEQKLLLCWCRDIEEASLRPTLPHVRQKGFRAIISATNFIQDNVLSLPYGASIAQNQPQICLDELKSHSLVLLFAGVETTQNLIGNLCFALLSNPSQLAILQADKAKSGAAVEEGLRYDPPVLGVLRRVLKETEIRGVRLPKGDEVVVMIGASNRDPARFSSPEKFNINRNQKGALAFGKGRHYCLGASLARSIAKIAIEQLFLSDTLWQPITDKLAWRNHDPIVRGLKELPVKLKYQSS